MNNYWIKLRGIDSINYYNFIKKYKNKDNIKYLFITNNIIESFHAKLSQKVYQNEKRLKRLHYNNDKNYER